MKQPNNQHTDRFEIAKVCPVCGSCRLQRKFNVRHVIDDPQRACALELGFAGATVVACRECSFLFKLQQPNAADLHEHYAESGEDYLVSLAEEHIGIREDFRVARQLLTDAFPKGGTILDIGCASGFFLESLGGTWERFGIELFHLAAERATGYIRGGVTALACKKDYPVYIDELAEICDVISVSAGMRGLQVLLAPEDYIRAVQAKVAAITKGEVNSH